MPPPTLDDLFAPIGASAFFASHWERRPLHLSGDGRLARALITHAQLEESLAELRELPSGLTLFPAHFDATLDARRLVADPSKLRAYLREGHALIWDNARGVWPGVDAVAATLSDLIGAQVWPNVYSTGVTGAALDAHFDAHEVVALQCDGIKRWTVSSVRVDRPLDVARMEPVIAEQLAARRPEALARTEMSFVSAPGDLVYIPRGQFHFASTPEGRSLHVTFGVRPPCGYDVMEVLAADALADPALREYLPPLEGRRSAAADDRTLEDITARLRAELTVERVSAVVASLRAAMMRRSRGPSGEPF